MIKIALYITLLSLSFGLQGRAQVHADILTDGLKNRMAEITGFEADALITVDVPFISIEPRIIKVKYTAPDVFDFEAKGLALLPKNGMKLEYLSILNGSNTAIPAGQEPVRGVSCEKVKVIPDDPASDIILAQLWMDPLTFRIMRMQTYTRKSGSYVINFFFPESNSILPTKMEVTFDIENLSAPAQMISEYLGNIKLDIDEMPKEARVIVEYQNMRVR